MQCRGDLDASCSGEVLVEVELLLQLRQLFRREVGASRPTAESAVVRLGRDLPSTAIMYILVLYEMIKFLVDEKSSK